MRDRSNREFGRLVGGALCLDFVNTVGARVGRPGPAPARDYADHIVDERLIGYDALLRWSAAAGALTSGETRRLGRQAAAEPRAAASVLARGLELREALYRLFKAAVEGWPLPTADLDVLNRELRIARAHERLVAAPRASWQWKDGPALDRVLWPIAASAAELLTGPALDRVGQCPGERCGWLFLDTSRSRRRQWCDMRECGTLAKVRRFRARQRRGSPARGSADRHV